MIAAEGGRRVVLLAVLAPCFIVRLLDEDVSRVPRSELAVDVDEWLGVQVATDEWLE